MRGQGMRSKREGGTQICFHNCSFRKPKTQPCSLSKVLLMVINLQLEKEGHFNHLHDLSDPASIDTSVKTRFFFWLQRKMRQQERKKKGTKKKKPNRS